MRASLFIACFIKDCDDCSRCLESVTHFLFNGTPACHCSHGANSSLCEGQTVGPAPGAGHDSRWPGGRPGLSHRRMIMMEPEPSRSRIFSFYVNYEHLRFCASFCTYVIRKQGGEPVSLNRGGQLPAHHRPACLGHRRECTGPRETWRLGTRR